MSGPLTAIGSAQDRLLPSEEAGDERPVVSGSLPKLVVGALGVVFGDIGTSPLYTMRECFSGVHGMVPTPENVLGLLSLIVWSLLLTVSAKYLLLVLRADNHGEGGILALTTLARHGHPFKTGAVIVIGLVGAALFYGDAIITPAISVLSAVEGLQTLAPGLSHLVVPLALVILVGLFVVQRHGTGRISVFFGPVMLLWFTVLGLLGLNQIIQRPEVLGALSPMPAMHFFAVHGWAGFAVLGSVVLAVTGAESLYADMGHFGRRPLRLAWFGFVLPALVLNYLGQGALILADPAAAAGPFYALAPDVLLLPLLLLATVATVIASQAVISGAFSLTRQAVQLGVLPRTQILHTSATQFGQIYLPMVNWALLAGVVTLVVAFGSSTSLAAAYGIAVTGTMVASSLLMLNVTIGRWRWPAGLAAAVVGGFLVIDLAFLGANLLKVADGGWMPLVVGALIYLLMSTWRHGRRLVAERRHGEGQSLTELMAELPALGLARVAGTAVYLTGGGGDLAPQSLQVNVRHNKVLHERLIVLSMETVAIPRVGSSKRLAIDALQPGIWRVTATNGFMQHPSVPRVLRDCAARGLVIDPADTSFFIGRIVPVPTELPGMPIWRETLFLMMTRTATTAAEFFRLPLGRTIEVGERVAI